MKIEKEFTSFDYELDEYSNPFDEDEEDEEDCSHCGPWCPDWGGDGICMVDCENMQHECEDYLAKHKLSGVMCPVCQKNLDCFSVRTDQIWVWPGDWYDPRVGLFEVYAAYDCSKGVIHSKGNIHHIWIGEGEYQEEKLINLLGKKG